jgi:splicing factor 3A subunit 3
LHHFVRARKNEIDALATTSDTFGEFYERLRVIKDHHRKYPNELVEPPELQFINQERQKLEDGSEESGKREKHYGIPMFFTWLMI